MESKKWVVTDRSGKEITKRYDTDQNARLEIVRDKRMSWAVLRQLGYKCIAISTHSTHNQ